MNPFSAQKKDNTTRQNEEVATALQKFEEEQNKAREARKQTTVTQGKEGNPEVLQISQWQGRSVEGQAACAPSCRFAHSYSTKALQNDGLEKSLQNV